jgi:quercetin 2,3-dioxygenase
MSFKKVSDKDLYVSEPNPAWFGNPANEKSSAWTNENWLKSRFHFSFAEYNNPKNASFGVLRVMNDDLVQPARGFGTHPHREMEICTYVVEGALTHKDSMGTQETLGPGSIQFMTAGTGVQHSEHNRSPDSPLRFIQMWIVPSARGLTPNYGSAHGADIVRSNVWAHMVSGVKSNSRTPVKINQDANLYVSELSPGNVLELTLSAGRQAYLLCVDGGVDVKVEGSTMQSLVKHDAAEVVGPVSLQLWAQVNKGAHLLYLEMQGSGQDSRFR